MKTNCVVSGVRVAVGVRATLSQFNRNTVPNTQLSVVSAERATIGAIPVFFFVYTLQFCRGKLFTVTQWG